MKVNSNYIHSGRFVYRFEKNLDREAVRVYLRAGEIDTAIRSVHRADLKIQYCVKVIRM